MNAGRMISSLIGAFGGGAVGRMLGGRMGGTIGSLAGSMLAGRMRGRGGSGGVGDMLGGLFGGDRDEADAVAASLSDDDALLLIRAMCSAAKADGQVDQSEIDAIVERAGIDDEEDEAFLRAELAKPLDLDGLIASVPDGMAAEVYTVSLLPIEVDTASEVEYLQQLGRGLGLSGEQIHSIHTELGLR